jgi:hypothetical protein
MPLDYDIDPAAGRVTIRYSGVIADAELMETFARVYQDPRHRVGMDELSDCRLVERLDVTAVGLQRLAEMTARLLDPKGTPWKVAIVVGQDVAFGLGRMYELLREGSPEHVRVFRDLGDADRWLLGGPDAA